MACRKYKKKKAKKSIPQMWFERMQKAQEQNTEMRCKISRYVISHPYDEDTRVLLQGLFRALIKQTDTLLDFCEGKL